MGAILFVCGSCYAQAPTADVQVPSIANTNSSMKLEDSTPVMLRTKQDLSSATVKVGDRVPFRVVKDVRVADLIVIPRGADAWGLVTAVQPKRVRGRPGNLDIAIQSVQLLTGENAPLRAEQHSTGKPRLITDPGLLGVGIPLVLLSMLGKGTDAHLAVGTKFTAYLNGDVSLDRMALERVQPAPVQRKGPATVTIFDVATARWDRRSVYCGKVALAKLRPSSYLKIQLPPGKYFFRADDEQIVEVRLEEGQEVYLHMQIVALKGGTKFKGHLVQVDNEDGEEEVANLNELRDKDVRRVSDADLAELKAAPEVK
jgi:hypothetical protein